MTVKEFIRQALELDTEVLDYDLKTDDVEAFDITALTVDDMQKEIYLQKSFTQP